MLFRSRFSVAPMIDVTTPTFRAIARLFSKKAMLYTEMIAANAIVHGKEYLIDHDSDFINPCTLQLGGSDPKVLADACRIASKFNYSAINLNAGCPSDKVQSGSFGAILMKTPDVITDCLKAMQDASDVPVTVKIRSGWDSNNINAVEVAKTIEKAGASAITVHPRTRAQGYAGLSDWNIIKQVKESVDIPVIGNGDIKTCYDAKRMIDETGCDAIMIGRACLGNPWLIKDTVNYLHDESMPKEISISEKIDMIKHHLKLLIKDKPLKTAILEMRTNAAWYLKGINGAKELKQQIFKVETETEFINLLDNFIKNEAD